MNVCFVVYHLLFFLGNDIFNFGHHSMYILWVSCFPIFHHFYPIKCLQKQLKKKIHAVKCIYICMHFQKQQNKKENLRQVKRSLHLFTMRGKTCRINVMYFISCKICEKEKKITWHYLALFFSSRNKPEAKSCWKTTFCTRIRYKPTALYWNQIL